MKKHTLALLVGLFLIVGFQNSYAENLFGEFKRLPDEIERGFSVGVDFGVYLVTGSNKRSLSNPGFQITLTTGYDLMKYLTLEGVYMVAINEASPIDPVLKGGMNSINVSLAAKGQYPLGRFYPFVEFGPGIFMSVPKFNPGEKNKLSFLFAGGFEYYTYLRHYSLYVKLTYLQIDLPIDALTFSAGIKYTF